MSKFRLLLQQHRKVVFFFPFSESAPNAQPLFTVKQKIPVNLINRVGFKTVDFKTITLSFFWKQEIAMLG